MTSKPLFKPSKKLENACQKCFNCRHIVGEDFAEDSIIPCDTHNDAWWKEATAWRKAHGKN